MADQSDVETALAEAAAAALAGCDTPCRVYRGWPAPQALEGDLAQGVVHVTLLPEGEARETTRYPARWRVIQCVTPSLAVSVQDRVVTFAGVPAEGQVAGVAIGAAGYGYAVQASDTVAAIAASLAVQIRTAGGQALANGATLTLPGSAPLIARVEQARPAVREIRRQSQRFRLRLWCASPALRDAIASRLDGALAAIAFLALPDGMGGRLTFAGGETSDQTEIARLYRRDLIYAVDYPTTERALLPVMLFGTGSLGTPAGALAPLLG